jgi:RNA polymerase sigma-70 factor (ECF subfamily)
MRTHAHFAQPILSGNFEDDLVALTPVIRRFAHCLTSGPELDDLVQDTLYRALTHQHQYTPGTNMRAWLFTILKHAFLDYRKLSHREVYPGERHLQQPVLPGQEWAVYLAQVSEAVDELSSAKKGALLSVSQGKSYEETALQCHCEMGTVKSRVGRAREQLYKQFTDLFNRDDAFASVVTNQIVI